MSGATGERAHKMILGLESTCDESAVALFSPGTGLIGEWIASQIALHGRHGGVVPDLASREHLRNLGPLLEAARETGHFPRVTSIAVARGPGLAPCLALGVAAARALGLALGVPVRGVNHLRGHVWSTLIPVHATAPAQFEAKLGKLLPQLGLIASGGNTLLYVLQADRSIVELSATRDDAAGEALDKGAKLLGLGYPGGPLIERHAREGRPDAYDFPRGIGPRRDLDFSFSGLKTSLRYRLEKMSEPEVLEARPNLCASYQEAVVDALVRKTTLALETGDGRFRSLGLSGGVANNRRLRERMTELARQERIPLLAAEPRHTGDNAGMIAFGAWMEPLRRAESELRLRPDLPLEDD